MFPPVPPQEAWTDWGGDGPLLHFAHANGFPPAAYRCLFEELRRSFRVAAFAARPLWPGSDPTVVESWDVLADDLRLELARRGACGAIGVGHSLGGVLSVLAAGANPSLFRALALIDPVVFTGMRSLYWGLSKRLGLGHRLPLIRGAKRRRDRFPDLETVRSSYARKSVFSAWDPEALEDYVQSAFEEDAIGQLVLRYPKDWEVRIFELTPASVWRDLRRLKLPMLFIRGASSDTFLAQAADRVRREVANATVVELAETSHFLPMERPARVAALISEWYEEIEGDG